MATLTIRNFDEELRHKLRVRAAENGRSMEGEVRHILADVLSNPERREKQEPTNWTMELYRLAGESGGVDLEIPDRDVRDGADRIPDFGEEE